jgi:hypothetical protein
MRRTRRVVVASVAGIAAVACVAGVIASGGSSVAGAASAGPVPTTAPTSTTGPTTTIPTTVVTHDPPFTTPTTGPVIPDETELYLSDAQVVEGNTNNPMMRFSVRLPLQAHRPVVFHAAVDAGGTAQADVDYVNPPNQPYTIPVGQSETFVNVPIISDTIDEPHETFFVVLKSPIENATILRGRAMGTIIDDDEPTPAGPYVVIGNVAVAEGKSATLTVTLSEPATTRTVVRWRTVDGTALKKHDYKAASGAVTFKKGESTKTIVVKTRRDKVDDPGEQFTVALFSPSSGWFILRSPGVVTLI